MVSEEEILRGLDVLIEPGQVFEVRALGDRISSGYFDDTAAAAKAIDALDAANPDGIYLTPNPVQPALLARRKNRIAVNSKKDALTADGDILRRRWLLIDIDAKRSTGISSTDAEHQAALDLAGTIAAALSEQGWPAPVTGDSGNGAHLLYRIDLPNDDKVTALIKAALVALDGLFSDAKASVDTAVFNASRIWKVYGTMARKGDSTDDRPHRRAGLISIPDQIEIVTREQIATLAATLPADPEPAGNKSSGNRKPGDTFDLAGWLREHGIGFSDSKPYQGGGTLYRLDDCPFSTAHSDGACAIQFASGAIYAGCHHASCGGGSQRWPELREKYEGPKKAYQGPAQAVQAPTAAPTGTTAATPQQAPTATPAPVALVAETFTPDVRREALEILKHGDPLEFMVETFHQDHVGDPWLARCLALSLASRLVKKSEGLHVMTTGKSGKGKSDGYRVMLKQVPEGYRLKGSFSDKALFYMKSTLRPQTVFFIDDQELSETMQEVLKAATTDFREPIHHYTVSTDRKEQDLQIPERGIWWIAKVEAPGDDQVKNRMLMPWVDDSAEQDLAVELSDRRRWTQDDDDDEDDTDRHAVKVCRCMWSELQNLGLIDVNTSRFADRVCFASAENRRNTKMFFNLVMSAAMINYYQRDRRELKRGTIRIYATEDDYQTAEAVFTAIHKGAGSQEKKLSREDTGILEMIDAAGLAAFTIRQLQDLTKRSYDSIRRTMNGYKKGGETCYPGLLETCPAIGTVERTVSTRISDDDRETKTINDRTIVYTFNRQVYRQWVNSGLRPVWLNPAGSPPADQGPDQPDDPICTICTQYATNMHRAGAHLEADNMTPDMQKSTVSSSLINYRKKDAPELHNGESIQAQDMGTNNFDTLSVCDPVPRCISKPISTKSSEIEKEPNFEEIQAQQPGAYPVHIECTPPPICTNTADEPQKTATGTLTINQVKPADYSKIDGQLVQPCEVCGGRVVHYVERFQARQVRGKQEKSRHICRSCYEQARDAEQAAVQILPGTIPLNEVEPVAPGKLGRCTTCGLQAATYHHPGSQSDFCRSCYEKIAREVDIR